MPSTHLALHYHVVFSTKNRTPSIAKTWRAQMHAYLAGTLTKAGAVPEAIGGVSDHVHLLFGLRATETLANVVRDVKAATSRWIHSNACAPHFQWQEGYGAFTVSASLLPRVTNYIQRQEDRHRVRTFEEEYRALLEGAGVVCDERFLQ